MVSRLSLIRQLSAERRLIATSLQWTGVNKPPTINSLTSKSSPLLASFRHPQTNALKQLILTSDVADYLPISFGCLKTLSFQRTVLGVVSRVAFLLVNDVHNPECCLRIIIFAVLSAALGSRNDLWLTTFERMC
jgi:hypothetical protein